MCERSLVLLPLNNRLECFFQILCDLLSPAGDSVKVGLRETAHNTSPHLRSKSHVVDAEVQPQSPVQKHQQHQARAASAHKHPDTQEVLAHATSGPVCLFSCLICTRKHQSFHLFSRNTGRASSVMDSAELIHSGCMAPFVPRRG